MKKQYIIGIALCGALTGSLMSCDNKNQDPAAAQASQQMPPLAVSVMPLQQQDVDIVSTWFGYLRGVEQADIRPEVSGKLLKQVYLDGSLCQKGEVLFEIDPASYKAAVDQAEASVAAAKASVLQARAQDDRAAQDLERFSRLIKSGSVSEKDYTDAQQNKKSCEAALAAAEAQVKLAEASLETCQINLDRCTIRAPFTGLATKASASTGELISASGAPLTTMSSVSPIRVDFSVPGKYILSRVLTKGYNAETGTADVIPEFELILEDGSVFEQKGKVVAVDSEVNKSTGTVNFVGHVPNPEMKLRAGSAVRVRAKIDEEKNAILVPARAILSSMNHRFIYVVAPDQTPLCIDVQLGESMILDMPNGDGTRAPMLMQVVSGTVKPIAETLKENGIDKLTEAQVIVEGTKMADIYSKVNMGMRAAGAKGGFAVLQPRPFIYKKPQTTTPSVTAKEQAPAAPQEGEGEAK